MLPVIAGMNHFRNALRAAKAAPVVSAVAVFSLALGIGANTAMFSIIDSLLLRSLPVEDPQRLVIVGQEPRGGTALTNPLWESIRDRQELFDGAFAFSAGRFNLARGGPTEFVDGLWASGRFFEVLGVPAILGRTWTPDDDRRGGGRDGAVAVISYAFWQRRFGGAADVIGRSLTVERVPFTIIGVTPSAFFGVEVGRTFDVAIPLGTEPLIRGKESALDRRSNWWLTAMGRLKAGDTLEQAQLGLRAAQPAIRSETLPLDWREDDKADYLKEAFSLLPAATGSSFLRTRYQRPLTTLMVVVCLVLLIACANIANLLLARATARRHEISVRLALGASRGRLVRQLLGESFVLAVTGAALGLVFASWFSHFLVNRLSTATSNVHLAMTPDWRVLGFTAGVAMLTALVFGTVPALRATRVAPQDAIKAQGRGISGQHRFALGNILVIVQVALSLVLLVGAGLFVRTFTSLTGKSLGFDAGPVLVAQVNFQPLQLEPAAREDLLARVHQAAAATPGVEHAALSAVTPISGSSWQYRLELLDGKPVEASDRGVYVNIITPDWLRTYGVKLLAGREFTAADRKGASAVAIVNETFVRKFLNGGNPIGHRVREPARPSSPNPEREIVGYVADSAYRTLREPVPATMYLPYEQGMTTVPSSTSISVKAAAGSPMSLARPLAAALTNVNPNIAVTFRTVSDQVNASLTQERLVALLSGFFGLLALLLAALGLYGVTSYAVSRRRAEIGVRMALGAAPGSVVRMVLGRVGVLVALGVVAGTGISLWAATFVVPLLYGLEPRDPATLVGAALSLVAIGALAGWIPATRAARIDPARVLREG